MLSKFNSIVLNFLQLFVVLLTKFPMNKVTAVTAEQEEKIAFVEEIQWMLENQKYDDTIICFDSQSLLTSIGSVTQYTRHGRYPS